VEEAPQDDARGDRLSPARRCGARRRCLQSPRPRRSQGGSVRGRPARLAARAPLPRSKLRAAVGLPREGRAGDRQERRGTEVGGHPCALRAPRLAAGLHCAAAPKGDREATSGASRCPGPSQGRRRGFALAAHARRALATGELPRSRRQDGRAERTAPGGSRGAPRARARAKVRGPGCPRERGEGRPLARRIAPAARRPRRRAVPAVAHRTEGSLAGGRAGRPFPRGARPGPRPGPDRPFAPASSGTLVAL
jgi:hypothetical protein